MDFVCRGKGCVCVWGGGFSCFVCTFARSAGACRRVNDPVVHPYVCTLSSRRFLLFFFSSIHSSKVCRGVLPHDIEERPTQQYVSGIPRSKGSLNIHSTSESFIESSWTLLLPPAPTFSANSSPETNKISGVNPFL